MTFDRITIPIADCISYLIWSQVTLYCLFQYNKKYGNDFKRFGYVTFYITASNALLGLTEAYGEDVLYSLRVLLELLQVTVALPCLTTEFWLINEVAQEEMAWAHIGLGLFPTYIYLFQHYTRYDLVDFAVFTNSLSLGLVGAKLRKFFAVCAGVLVFVAHAFLSTRHEIASEMPSRQALNYVMCAFTYCGYKALM